MQHKGRKTIGIIPARYASSRFPGKPLVKIAGKSMIKRVYEQASQAKSLDMVVVATDDARIFEHVKSWGGLVEMTSLNHQSGTDRCAEVLRGNNAAAVDIVVNIQGDEPFIQPEQIDFLVAILKEKKEQATIATLAKRIDNPIDIHNANVVKVVFDTNNKGLYFSRHPLPFLRGEEKQKWFEKANYYKHIGLYAFRANTLLDIVKLPQSVLEKAESLEQLRWLENGYAIQVGITNLETRGIDTPEDLEELGID